MRERLAVVRIDTGLTCTNASSGAGSVRGWTKTFDRNASGKIAVNPALSTAFV